MQEVGNYEKEPQFWLKNSIIFFFHPDKLLIHLGSRNGGIKLIVDMQVTHKFNALFYIAVTL